MKKLSLVLIACGATVGATAQIPVGVDLGVYLPSNSDTKDVFGSSWFRVGLSPLGFQQPGNWRFTFDVGFLRRDRSTFVPNGGGGGGGGGGTEGKGGGGGTTYNDEVTLIPVTFGYTKSFTETTDFMPYLALRVGPYFADVKSDHFGVDKSGIGFNANASLGISVSKQFYIEARYDWYSKFKGINFSGLSFAAGIKLFEIRL